MQFNRMSELDLRGKTVLIRQDLNVPLDNGRVASDQRIVASLPTIRNALAAGAGVMVMSHLGRPVEGEFAVEFSMQPIAEHLSHLLSMPVTLVSDYLGRNVKVCPGEVEVLENVRFNLGEKADEPSLAKAYAELADVFVMDAFGTAHRAQASTHGAGLYAKRTCAGPLLEAELDALGRALASPQPPTVAIVGGSKVSTKLTLLSTLVNQVDQLIPGGGIANTFIAAAGYDVGKSLFEPDLVAEAGNLIVQCANKGGAIPVPVDVVVGESFDAETTATIRPVDQVGSNEMILDIGPQTAENYANLIKDAGTVVWNGPVGVFEFPQFSAGTQTIGQSIAEASAFSIAGGGDTLAAIDAFELGKGISYISTGGGAFLEFLEGKTLPAVAMLEKRFSHNPV